MIVYRVSQRKRSKDLSGRGAFKVGGRWSNKGVHALYTAMNASLAAWEVFVHQITKEEWPSEYCLIAIQIPDRHKDILRVSIKTLPRNWDELPYSSAVQQLGKVWFDKNKLAVIVPSAVMKGEFNVILNPLHTQFKSLVKITRVENFQFDERLKSGYLWKQS